MYWPRLGLNLSDVLHGLSFLATVRLYDSTPMKFFISYEPGPGYFEYRLQLAGRTDVPKPNEGALRSTFESLLSGR